MTQLSRYEKSFCSSFKIWVSYPRTSQIVEVIDYLNETNIIPIFEEAEKISDPEKRLIFFLRRYSEIMTMDASSRIAVHEAGKLKPHHSKKVKQNWRKIFNLIRDAISKM